MIGPSEKITFCCLQQEDLNAHIQGLGFQTSHFLPWYGDFAYFAESLDNYGTFYFQMASTCFERIKFNFSAVSMEA